MNELTQAQLQDQAEARANLIARGIKNKQRLASGDTKELVWLAPPTCPTNAVCQAKVGRGFIILQTPVHNGVPYCAAFGPNSDDSHSGFLTHVSLEEAKLLVYGDVSRANRW